jgi:DNA-binding response OmpR family regulator
MTPRVLIVDDNEALAELASYVLSAAGFTVETLTDSSAQWQGLWSSIRT